MHEEPTAQHHWLMKLVGEWTSESECSMGPGQPPMVNKGTEIVRSLGGLWTLGEGFMDGENGGQSMMTLGYDRRTKRFVGTFIASMMTHLWPYSGEFDVEGKVLILDSEGPNFLEEGAIAQYQDLIEFIDDNHRTLSSRVQNPNGEWVPFMSAHYRRKV